MKNILLLLVIGVVAWKWYGGDFAESAEGAFDEQGKPVVLAFTFAECGAPCADGLAELDKRAVPYRELVISRDKPDDDSYKLWEKLGSIASFPLIVAGKETVVGTSKAQLATLLAENFQEQYLTSYEKRYFSRHFTAGEPQIVLYGTAWCPACKQLREDMRAEGISFVDIDVDAASDKTEMLGTMEINGYPATWYGYRRMRGTSWAAIKAEM